MTNGESKQISKIMRCQVFTDPVYHAEMFVEFDPAQVVAIERKTVTLFLRGKRQTTYITLKSGARHGLEGDLAEPIEAARRQRENSP